MKEKIIQGGIVNGVKMLVCPTWEEDFQTEIHKTGGCLRISMNYSAVDVSYWKELEEIAKQCGRNSWKYLEYLKKNFKHIGEEIPENIPFSEYRDYILRNFRITKPMKEWTDIDYKVYNSWQKRLLVLFSIKEHGWKEPFDDRQKRIIERVRNGTDYDILAGECPEWFQ